MAESVSHRLSLSTWVMIICTQSVRRCRRAGILIAALPSRLHTPLLRPILLFLLLVSHWIPDYVSRVVNEQHVVIHRQYQVPLLCVVPRAGVWSGEKEKSQYPFQRVVGTD